ncbi:T9SS type A sorting domain-containing protein [Thalassobellus citreus]|uniref:T9SS type A sorting domain-containing protein n=1 Tax=Thalassobellus citreus TaxID=3367752 RepID=UPI003787B50D
MKKNTLFVIGFLCVNMMFSQVDLAVENGGLVYVSKSADLFISNSGDLSINGTGEFIMDSGSSAFSNVYIDGASTGVAEYRRWVASVSTRDLIAPPVTGEAFNLFYSRNTASIVAGTQGGDWLFGDYDNNNSLGVYNEFSDTDTDVLTAGIGYRSATVSGGTLSFQGVIKTGDVPVVITAGTGKNRYANLIGNPYSSAISASNLLAVMSSSSAFNSNYVAVYGYDGAVTSDGSTWGVLNSTTLLGEPGGDVDIMPGQGFMVYADADGGTLTFTKAMQKVSSKDDFITGKSVSKKINSIEYFNFKLKINDVSDENKFYNADLYFINNHVTRGLDVSWDSGAFSLPSLSITTELADNSSKAAFQIQALPLSDLSSTDLVIPVRLNVKTGASYKISMDASTLPEGTKIYLQDTELNTFTLLEDSYTFTSSQDLNSSGRFYLTTSNKTLNTEDLAISNINIVSILKAKQIMISDISNHSANFSLIDLSGRVIIDDNFSVATNDKKYVDVSHVSEGVYIVRLKLKNSNTVITKKVLVN